MLRSGVGTVATTSCGRLFDAVAALCGLARRVSFEGQPAMQLEFLAADTKQASGYPMHVHDQGGSLVLDPALALARIIEDLDADRPAAEVAAAFHVGLAAALAELAGLAATRTGVRRIALGGGCFQNRLLLCALVPALEEQGFEVLLARRVPPNDGGLALGQAAIYAAGKE